MGPHVMGAAGGSPAAHCVRFLHSTGCAELSLRPLRDDHFVVPEDVPRIGSSSLVPWGAEFFAWQTRPSGSVVLSSHVHESSCSCVMFVCLRFAPANLAPCSVVLAKDAPFQVRIFEVDVC
jgi:hypothetical protein